MTNGINSNPGKLNENDFFHQATLRICGNLDIEEAMSSTLQFLRQKIPVDRIFLQFFDVGLKAFHTVAIVTQESGMVVDLLIPLSSEAINELTQFEKKFFSQNKNVAFLENEPYELAINREYFLFHKTNISSIIVVPLGLRQEMLGHGSLFFVTQGEQKFTGQHADLLSLLKEPFAIAMCDVEYPQASRSP